MLVDLLDCRADGWMPLPLAPVPLYKLIIVVGGGLVFKGLLIIYAILSN